MRFRGKFVWLALPLTLATGLSTCAREEPGVLLEVWAPNDPELRPENVWVYWLSPAGLLIEGRMPEVGSVPAEGDLLGTLFIDTNGALEEARAVVATGQRGDEIVSGAVLRVDPTGPRAIVRLRLEGPLPDQDGNGVPDVVESNCQAADYPLPCSPPSEGEGSPGGGSIASIDGGASRDAPGRPRDGPPGRGPPIRDGGVPPGPRPPGAGDASPPPAPLPTGDAGAGDAPPPAPPATAEVLRPGLVAHWPFEEGVFSNMTGDVSGNGNRGAVFGSVFLPVGRVGRAIAIGTNDNNGVVVSPTSSLETIRAGFTIAGFVQRRNAPGGVAGLLTRRGPNSDRESYGLVILSTGQARGTINAHMANQTGVVLTPLPVPFGRWIHLAFTFDGQQLALYLDGELAATTPYADPLRTGSIPLCLGCAHKTMDNEALSDPLGGLLDELVLYSRPLPADEIRLLASGVVPPPPP